MIAWHEEVDKAFKKELLKNIKYSKKGVLTDIPSKNVVVRKPEEDYKIEVYPSVSVYNITDTLALDRQPFSRYSKLDVVRQEQAIGTYSRPNEPLNLSYQLDFFAKYKTDMNAMIHSWISSGHLFQWNLMLNEDSADILSNSCNVMQTGSIVHSDFLEEKERIFHDIITYTIWVEIADETVYTTNIAESVTINLQGLND